MSDGRTWGTIIGGVVGFFTGGIGFAAGAAIGGAVGGLLEPKQKTETNRIDDVKVSISKYGDGIPETWGNNIPTATCVWSTYIIELPEEPTGGKGGGVENTNYRQFIQSMWCVGKTPPPGSTVTIRKVWINGKLNFDASSGLSVGQALATEENPWAQIAILPGFDDQLPVAMMETYEGVGNVPAFRGRICLFIFGLECPGGRIPQLQFELCIDASTVQQWQTLGELDPGDQDIPSGVIKKTEAWHLVFSRPVGAQIFKSYYIDHGSVTYNGETRVAASRYLSFPIPVAGSDPGKVLLLRGDNSNTLHIDSLELQNNVLLEDVALVERTETIIFGNRHGAAQDPTNATYVLLQDAGTFGGMPYVFSENGAGDFRGLLVGECGPIAAYDGFLHCIVVKTIGADRLFYLDTIDAETGTLIDSVPAPMAPNPSLNIVYKSRIRSDETGTYVYLLHGAVPAVIAKYAGGSWTILSSDATLPSSASLAGDNVQTFYANDLGATIGPTEADGRYLHLRFRVVEPNPASVQDFIEHQSLRSGLVADQIDVSAINDSFWGLTLKTPASARANIAPVLTYSAIGVVEEDALLRYFHRKDKISVATIDYDELGFAEDGSEPSDPFPVVHLNAQELPRSVTVSYNDYNFDYQVSTAKAMRYAVDSVLDENVTLDIATDGERAATIAYRLLFERWLAQNTRSLAVSRKYAYLSAGDVITVLSRDGSYGDWMTSKITDTGARIEIECFPADSDLLIQVVPGPGGFPAQQIQPLASLQRVEIVDGPIWRDADNNAGLYVAMEPFSGAPGAELFVGDDDSSLQSRGVVQNASIIGVAESALGTWTSALMDETNTVVINVGDGELNSTTRALLDTTTVNTAALGLNGRWEYLQFLRAADLGSGRFMLSGLARGMRGTQRNRGNHVSGDHFVLLGEAGVLRPGMDVGAIGSAKYYRAISKGRSFNSASSKVYANTGEGLKPFSPWDARWTKAATNDITMTWQRRTRLSSNSLRGIVPLSEATEAYVIELYTTSGLTTLAGTFTSNTNSLTVTSAQQAAIGLTPGATPYRRIYQISESVGRGAPLEAIV